MSDRFSQMHNEYIDPETHNKPVRRPHVYKIRQFEIERTVRIDKEWSMKFGRYLYRVVDCADDRYTLLNTSTFKEAREFVRTLADEEQK